MSTNDALVQAVVDHGEEAQSENQLTALAAVALLILILCIVLLLVFSTSISGFGPAFQTAIVVITNRIQGSFPGAFALLQQSALTVQAAASTTLNQASNAITEGVTKFFNVLASVGQGVLSTILQGFGAILSVLTELGGDILKLFASVFQPLVTVVQILGSLIIDSLSLTVAQYSPIITLINALVQAIVTIGQKF